jgi:hypothetical protein
MFTLVLDNHELPNTIHRHKPHLSRTEARIEDGYREQCTHFFVPPRL